MAPTIALDAMGGDHAPEIVIAGAAMALEQEPSLHFILFGDQTRVEPLLSGRTALSRMVELRHTPDMVKAHDKPSAALRHGRNSSMRLAIDAVRAGDASAVVSAGNTGALMAIAKFVLKTLPGIDRPAIAAVVPTGTRPVLLLDLGANIECTPELLFQFAVMGEVFSRAVLGVAEPKVALLNVGTEEVKGDDVVRAAAALIRDSNLPIDFVGFVEGDGILGGAADVIVTDGFTGNVALKTAEGAARLMAASLREGFTSSLRSRLAYLIAKPALAKLRERFDPRRYNGAMFLGLNGVVVKSHGGADALGFCSAIKAAVDVVQKGTLERIADEMGPFAQTSPSEAQLAAS